MGDIGKERREVVFEPLPEEPLTEPVRTPAEQPAQPDATPTPA